MSHGHGDGGITELQKGWGFSVSSGGEGELCRRWRVVTELSMGPFSAQKETNLSFPSALYGGG